MQKIRGRLIAHFDGLDEKIKNRNKNLYHNTHLWKKVSSQYVHCNNKKVKIIITMFRKEWSMSFRWWRNKTSSYKFIFKMMKSTSQDYLNTKVRLNPPPACPDKIFPSCTDFFPAKRLDQLSWFIFLISRNEYQKKLSDFYFGGLCHSTSSYYSHNKIVEKCTEKTHAYFCCNK